VSRQVEDDRSFLFFDAGFERFFDHRGDGVRRLGRRQDAFGPEKRAAASKTMSWP